MVLIIIILIVSFVVNTDTTEKKIQQEQEIEKGIEDGHGDIVVQEETRSKSNYKVKNLQEILNYLDPSEMLNYDDLLTLYAVYISKCVSNNPGLFYEENEDTIQEILGIYNKRDFLKLHERIVQSGISENSKISHMEITKIEQNANLLKVYLNIVFDNAILNIEHYINYEYINGEPYLFIYSS